MPDNVDLVKQMIESQCETLRQWQKENREAQSRIHERLDMLINQPEGVSIKGCEETRTACRQCTNLKIEKMEKKVGVPAWLIPISSVATGLFVAMIMFIIQLIRDGHAAQAVTTGFIEVLK